MEPRLKWNKIIFRVLLCSAVRPVPSYGGLRFVRRWSAVVCGFQTYPINPSNVAAGSEWMSNVFNVTSPSH